MMVLSIIGNEGDAMPPNFFAKRLKIKAEEYEGAA
jgi:hypothetical protein